MLAVKTNPVGIDVLIQKFQTKLHAYLLTKWDLQDGEYKCYGRVYRNQDETAKGYIAENYEGVGAENEYKEVYLDDTVKASSFFGIATRSQVELGEKLNVHLVFFVNLDKVKPNVVHRADEEVRIDVLNLIGANIFGFKYDGVELGIENVLREYPGSRRDDRLKFADMHPYHCFRINFTINYNKNICSSITLKN